LRTRFSLAAESAGDERSGGADRRLMFALVGVCRLILNAWGEDMKRLEVVTVDERRRRLRLIDYLRW
jgi:hypothetical protein